MGTSRKIQDLVAEATTTYDHYGFPSQPYEELNIEKFARLLVEEVIARTGVTDDTANEIREYFWPE